MVAGTDQVVLWGDGSPTREFLYVEDAADAFVLAGERYSGGEPLNIGTGAEISIRELAETIAELTGFDGEIVWDETMPNGQPRRRLDTTPRRGRARLAGADVPPGRARAHHGVVPGAGARRCRPLARQRLRPPASGGPATAPGEHSAGSTSTRRASRRGRCCRRSWSPGGWSSSRSRARSSTPAGSSTSAATSATTYTTAWLLAHGLIPPATGGYLYSLLLAPVAAAAGPSLLSGARPAIVLNVVLAGHARAPVRVRAREGRRRPPLRLPRVARVGRGAGGRDPVLPAPLPPPLLRLPAPGRPRPDDRDGVPVDGRAARLGGIRLPGALHARRPRRPHRRAGGRARHRDRGRQRRLPAGAGAGARRRAAAAGSARVRPRAPACAHLPRDLEAPRQRRDRRQLARRRLLVAPLPAEPRRLPRVHVEPPDHRVGGGRGRPRARAPVDSGRRAGRGVARLVPRLQGRLRRRLLRRDVLPLAGPRLSGGVPARRGAAAPRADPRRASRAHGTVRTWPQSERSRRVVLGALRVPRGRRRSSRSSPSAGRRARRRRCGRARSTSCPRGTFGLVGGRPRPVGGADVGAARRRRGTRRLRRHPLARRHHVRPHGRRCAVPPATRPRRGRGCRATSTHHRAAAGSTGWSSSRAPRRPSRMRSRPARPRS